MNTEPAWLKAARAYLGVRETPGVANNLTILGWAKRLGIKVLGIVYNADSAPWCGLFVTECLAEVGVGLAGMKIGVRASSWEPWGKAVPFDALAPGTILVFKRPGGGHVGFYVGEDYAAYHVLGGNQGDAVTITRIDKKRLVAARWPVDQPLLGHPIMMAARPGAALSTGEA